MQYVLECILFQIPSNDINGLLIIFEDALSSFLDFSSFDRQTLRPLLFPCGNLRKETLPSALQASSIPLQSVVSYTTNPHSALKPALLSLKERKVCSDLLSPFNPSLSF